MKEAFTEINFKPGTLETIDRANAIIAEYTGQGFRLTLRQLYYQFVARGHIENAQSEYKRLGSIVNDGRLADHSQGGRLVETFKVQMAIGAYDDDERRDFVEMEFRAASWDAAMRAGQVIALALRMEFHGVCYAEDGDA